MARTLMIIRSFRLIGQKKLQKRIILAYMPASRLKSGSVKAGYSLKIQKVGFSGIVAII